MEGDPAAVVSPFALIQATGYSPADTPSPLSSCYVSGGVPGGGQAAYPLPPDADAPIDWDSLLLEA